MKKNNLFVIISIFLIRTIWHGKFGRNYNKRKKIICRFYPTYSNYSIICQKGNEETVKKIMQEVYKKYTGFEIGVDFK